MLHARKAHRSMAFKRFLVSYLVILLIPIVIGTYAYQKTVQVIEEDAARLNLSILEQSRDMLDSQLQEVEKMANRLKALPKVNYFSHVDGPLNDEGYYKIYELLNEIGQFSVTNFVHSYYIYFKKSRTLISSETRYELPESYDDYFRYANMDYPTWLSRIAEANRKTFLPAETVHTVRKAERLITYVSPLPSNSGESAQVTVIVLIRENEILKMLNNLVIDGGGWSYIMDDADQVITAASPAPEPASEAIRPMRGNEEEETAVFPASGNGKEMIISSTVSSYNGWKYYSALPVEVVYAKAVYIKNITGIIVAVALLSGMVIAFLLAHRSSKPLWDMVVALREFAGGDSDKKSEYDVLRGTILELISTNRNMKYRMEEQLPFLQAAFFRRLFRGEFHSLEEYRAFLSQTQLTVRGQAFAVAIVRFTGYNEHISEETLIEWNRNKWMAKHWIGQHLGHYLLWSDWTEDTLVLLIDSLTGTEAADKREVAGVMEQLFQLLTVDHKRSVSMSVGTICRSPLDIWRAFNEAVQALDFSEKSGTNTLVSYDDIPKTAHHYFFPMDLELRLTNNLKSGDREGLDQHLRLLHAENFEKRLLTPGGHLQLVDELRAMLVKLLGQPQYDRPEFAEVWKSLDHMDQEPAAGTYDFIINQCYAVCDKIHQLKVSNHQHLINNMIRFIRDHHDRADLCLSSVAGHFHLSEGYVSYFFKEQTSENFSAYLEKVRMDHARELLLKEELSIVEIAVMVGYNSDKAFRRAFKRALGVQPLAYRESQRGLGDKLNGTSVP